MLLVPKLQFGNAIVFKSPDLLTVDESGSYIPDYADETEFRGQVRSQSGDWERGEIPLP